MSLPLDLGWLAAATLHTTAVALVVLAGERWAARRDVAPATRHRLLVLGLADFALVLAAAVVPAPARPAAFPRLSAMSGAGDGASWFARGVTLLLVTGALVVALRVLVAWRRVGRLRRDTRPASDGPAVAAVAGLAPALGLSRSPEVRVGDAVPAPAVVGPLRPALLLPTHLAQGLPAAELCAVVAHELAHLRRRDLALRTAIALLAPLWWWHPLFRLLDRRQRAIAEEACDDLALRATGGDRRPFRRALVACMASRDVGLGAAPTCALGDGRRGRRDLEHRVRRLGSPTRDVGPARRLAAAILAAAALGTMPAIGEPGPPPDTVETFLVLVPQEQHEAWAERHRLRHARRHGHAAGHPPSPPASTRSPTYRSNGFLKRMPPSPRSAEPSS